MLLHADFYVHSMNDSLKFYIGALGFTKIDDFEIEGKLVRYLSDGMHSKCRAVLLKVGMDKAMIELVEFLDNKTDCKSWSRGYITLLVPSINEKICDLQIKNINPISDIFYVTCNRFGKSKIVFYSDLDGNKIELLEKITS